MAGKAGRSGRKKIPSTLIKEAIENDSQNLPSYFEKLAELAKSGDREALFYLIDRHLGKAKQTVSTDIIGGERLGIGIINQILDIVATQRRELLEEPSVVVEEVKQIDNKPATD